MTKELDMMLRGFWSGIGSNIEQFTSLPDSCTADNVNSFEVYQGYLQLQLSKAVIPESAKTKLKICLLLAREMGVLNDCYFYRKIVDIRKFESFLDRAKNFLAEEKAFGLDRNFYKRDYDLLLIMKKNQEYDLMHDKILNMAHEISDNYFDYLLKAEKELGK